MKPKLSISGFMSFLKTKLRCRFTFCISYKHTPKPHTTSLPREPPRLHLSLAVVPVSSYLAHLSYKHSAVFCTSTFSSVALGSAVALPHTSCVSMGKLMNLSVLGFHIFKVTTLIDTILLNHLVEPL